MGDAVEVEIPVWFRAQMTRLMGLKFAPADLLTHWEGLGEVPPAVLEAAVRRAQQTRVEFPTPAELRMDADAVKGTVQPFEPEEDRSVALAAPVTLGTLPTGQPVQARREWRYYCARCNDCGVQDYWCGAVPAWCHPRTSPAECGRTFPHGPHAWGDVCVCWDSNPAIQRRAAQQRTYAKAPRRIA